MKNLICLFLLILTFDMQAQNELYKKELPLNDKNRIEFVEVIEVPGKSKDELYVYSKIWIAENYNSANNVIQLDDKTAGKIIVKGIYSYNMHTIAHKLYHTLEIYQKEGKVRISLTGLDLKYRFMDVNVTKQMRELVIDDLYKKNGNPYKGSKAQKENLIRYWESTKESIKKSVSENAGNEDDW